MFLTQGPGLLVCRGRTYEFLLKNFWDQSGGCLDEEECFVLDDRATKAPAKLVLSKRRFFRVKLIARVQLVVSEEFKCAAMEGVCT
jgi:hypothetical protein